MKPRLEWGPSLPLARIAAALVLLVSGAAWARPGGGGSFHGGGGGGHGGFGGGGIGGGYHGVPSTGSSAGDVVVFAILLLVVVFVLAQRRRLAAFDGGARNALGQANQGAAFHGAASLAVLRARDPAISEQSIADHVRPMADALRAAWCGGDMRPARAFVSDGVFSRFQVQLALMAQENRRNVMGDARVLDVAVVAVESAGPLDVVHARLTAEARDAEVPVTASEDQIRATLARTGVEPYTEIWSLVRRAGTVTKPPGFPVGRVCPACGAPLDAGETLQCRYCRALVCSGEHDWVLAEITQPSEWHPTSRAAPGLGELSARDPGTAREVLEDRASYLFWKWIQAGRLGRLGPLRKSAASALLGGGARIEWTRGASDVAVGGAELLACERGDDGYDRAYVEVVWSARFGGSRSHTPAKTVMRLARKVGVVSKLSMTALVCPACGAPLSETDSTQCDHCRVELTDGERTWILDAVLAPRE